MSELINISNNCATIRRKLLTSASALALTAYISSANVAKADDADRPSIWIELGGQMENVSGQGEVFAPAFLAANPNSPVLNSVTPLRAQKPPAFSLGEEGKISFQPENSDWVLSAAIRYGRSSSSREVDHQTGRAQPEKYVGGEPFVSSGGKVPIQTTANFADTQSHRQERHIILDFSVGKDVGLGVFGTEGSSTFNLGVQFAQFESKARFDIRARPDLQIKYYPSAHASSRFLFPHFNTYHATGYASRSFRGVGPALSWNSSMPFVGNRQDGELTFDWSVNAALLFGKQKAHAQHQESAHYHKYPHPGQYYLVYQHPPAGHDTDRSVTVPNVGGSVGLSLRIQDFKVSFGYRADFFFGAMDTGIDVAKKSNLTFDGPYASISVGLGD